MRKKISVIRMEVIERSLLISLFLLYFQSLFSQNPIVPNMGLNDPHIHIFEDKAYVYASHDKSINNTRFIMENWWVWSSPDLVNWTKETILKPEDTYIGTPFTGCWATDAAYKNGKYYWYFSEKNQQSGVVVGDSPVGPWSDPLGKPLLSEELTPTDEYDMGVFAENGEHYIIFGVWDYYMARLNEDMISLAEKPKKIEIANPRGPYNQDGSNKEKPTDDKPFIHKYKDTYYLSWGCFYATSTNLYGPYIYQDNIIKKESFAPGYDAPTWPNGYLQGRHGSFFEWHNQWYFAYCDISQTGNRYFRDTFISYVHYRNDGSIAPIDINGIGVGRYEATQPRIEVENYFKSEGFQKINKKNQFLMKSQGAKSILNFPNIEGAMGFSKIALSYLPLEKGTFEIEITRDSPNGARLATKKIEIEEINPNPKKLIFSISDFETKENLYIHVQNYNDHSLYLDYFTFIK